MKRQKQSKIVRSKTRAVNSFSSQEQLEKLLLEGLASPSKPMSAARLKRIYKLASE